MKKKVIFNYTVGSQWVDGYDWPQGGTSQETTIEFETDGGASTFDDAVDALRKHLCGQSFHIVYWDFI